RNCSKYCRRSGGANSGLTFKNDLRLSLKPNKVAFSDRLIMSENTKEIETFQNLLLEFQRLLPLKRKPRTLLEISRFPRSELACSNILAFFLDPNEEHGLGDIVLNSLLEASGHDKECMNQRLESVEVKREDRTDSNK